MFVQNDGTRILVAARALATYLIPGCVGRGVRLGSENSSAGGGVWKSGNHDSQKVLPRGSKKEAHDSKKVLPWGPKKRPITPNKIQYFAYFPWWANGPYSPGVGPCCYLPRVGK